jgi:hypothetical protein
MATAEGSEDSDGSNIGCGGAAGLCAEPGTDPDELLEEEILSTLSPQTGSA